MASMAPNFALTDKEKSLFGLLMNVVEKGPPVTLRVAGGWVRDKLLQKESEDIDIALDTMMGKDFAERVNQHLKDIGHATKTIGVIKVNPEQSKHLETATVNIDGTWVDFVNLRSEEYQNGSRIPKIEFGTPEDDAHRRDLTINALFYNINQNLVEDFTGKGLEDLRGEVIRTPLDPRKTFDDDPLRCLRVIRFANRLGFTIEPVTMNALRDPRSFEAIRRISRERIGIEVNKMMGGPAPLQAIGLLLDTGLLRAVFQPETPENIPEQDRANLRTPDTAAFDPFLQTIRSTGREFYLSLALAMLRQPSDRDGLDFANAAVMWGLKLPTKDAKAAATVLEGAEMLLDLVHGKRGGSLPPAFGRREVGLFLLKVRELWGATLALAATVAHSPELFPFYRALPSLQARLPAEAFLALMGFIREERMEGCWERKPLLNGKEISTVLGLPQGPVLGKIIQSLVEWQLENPEANKEQAKDWLLSREWK